MASKYQNMSSRIAGLLCEAKDRNGMTDSDIASTLGCCASTIRHRKSDKTLPEMTFAAVWTLAEMAGYELDFKWRG